MSKEHPNDFELALNGQTFAEIADDMPERDTRILASQFDLETGKYTPPKGVKSPELFGISPRAFRQAKQEALEQVAYLALRATSKKG